MEDDRLAQLARLRLDEWLAVKPIILRQCRLNKAKTRFIITRLLEEWEKVKKKKRGGIKSGEARNRQRKNRPENSEQVFKPKLEQVFKPELEHVFKQNTGTALENESESEDERASKPLQPLRSNSNSKTSPPLQPLKGVLTAALLQKCRSEEAKNIETRKDYMQWIKDLSPPNGFATYAGMWGNRWAKQPKKARSTLLFIIEQIKEGKIRISPMGAMADAWKRRP